MHFDDRISRSLVASFALTLTGALAAACAGENADNGTPLQPTDTPVTPVPPPVVAPDPVVTVQPTTSVAPSTPTPAVPPPSPSDTGSTETTATTDPTSMPVTSAPVNPTPPVDPTPPTPPGPDVPGPSDGSKLGTGVHTGSGAANAESRTDTENRYKKGDVTRDGVNYFFMANGWGPGFESQSVTWSGTAFTVESMTGVPGPNYEPASYPTMFCGVYSDSQSQACGLPAAISDIDTLRTGWRWKANGNTADYNVAYDIWVANGPSRNNFSGFLMVWLRDPPGQQPAGRPDPAHQGITVDNVPGTWDVWIGTVNRAPIINWVKAEGQDIEELEFDAMDFVRDAPKRGFEVPGTHILSVAVGFELWEGPVTNLVSEDFYVDVVMK